MEGGSANDYDYGSRDPVNSFDLDGLCKKHKGILGRAALKRGSFFELFRRLVTEPLPEAGTGYGDYAQGPVASCAVVTHLMP